MEELLLFLFQNGSWETAKLDDYIKTFTNNNGLRV
jgi:hypothetical protein